MFFFSERMVCYRDGALNDRIYVVEEQDESKVKQLLRQNLYKLSLEQTHTLPDILRYVAYLIADSCQSIFLE